MSILRNAVLAGLMLWASAGAPVLGQDDVKKSEIQKECAKAKDHSPLRRFRLDGYTVDGGKVVVSGVFLRGGLGKKSDKPLTAAELREAEDIALNDELTPVFAKVLDQKNPALNLKDKLKVIAVEELPHLKLQKAANDDKRYQVLTEPVTFDKDGKAVVTARVGSPADKDWLTQAAKEFKDLPLVASGVSTVEWKLSPERVQENLATSGGDLARIRVERIRFEWAISADGLLRPRAVIDGLYLDSPIKETDFDSLVQKTWPELPWEGMPQLTIDASATLGPKTNRVPEKELVNKLRQYVAKRKDLDGVRIDEKMSFDGAGRLVLQGIVPVNDVKFAEQLAAAVKEGTEEAGSVENHKELAFARTTAKGVSSGKMREIQTRKLLAEVREWACTNVDDLLLSRLYFKPDEKGDVKLSLVGRYAEAGTNTQALEEFRRASRGYFDNDEATLKTLAIGMDPFPGLTAHLRALVLADQKTWAGVLVERGCFEENGKYTVRGVADTQGQREKMTQVLDEEKANPRWDGYSLKDPGYSVRLDVVPMQPMLDRLKRVAPGYAGFDHLELTKVAQQPKGGLTFSADSFEPSDSEWAGKTAKWLLDMHPDWKRRSKGGVKIEAARKADQSAESSWLAPALAAEAMAQGNLPKARLYIDSAVRHHPGSSGTWYLSALYHSHTGDRELVRRDMYRVIQIEKELVPTGGAFRDDERERRYGIAEKIGPGDTRSSAELMEVALRREMRDGRKQIQLIEEKMAVPK